MAQFKYYQCRDHGGQFKAEVRRGRPPVQCTDENQCSRWNADLRPSELEPPPTVNPSLAPAKAAKEKLVALGWTVQGKAASQWADVSASRGDETLHMRWIDGEILTQSYSLFAETTEESRSELPGFALNFNPDELTDGELVQRLSGMKVKWWNSLANSAETAVVGTKVSIEHIFDQGDTHDASKRVFKFIDHSGGGFRAFHVGALLKVG